ASRASEGSDSRGQTSHHELSPGRGVGDRPIDPARRASGDVEADAQTKPGGGAGDTREADDEGPEPPGDPTRPRAVAAEGRPKLPGHQRLDLDHQAVTLGQRSALATSTARSVRPRATVTRGPHLCKDPGR